MVSVEVKQGGAYWWIGKAGQVGWMTCDGKAEQPGARERTGMETQCKWGSVGRRAIQLNAA